MLLTSVPVNTIPATLSVKSPIPHGVRSDEFSPFSLIRDPEMIVEIFLHLILDSRTSDSGTIM